MSLLTWNPQFSVGVESVDEQHQSMIAMINRAYEEMLDGQDMDRPELFLSDIYIEVAAHFAHEERLMVEARYHEYRAHREDHVRLLAELREIMEGYLDDPESSQEQLKTSLSDWFSVHFSTFDARLAGQLGI